MTSGGCVTIRFDEGRVSPWRSPCPTTAALSPLSQFPTVLQVREIPAFHALFKSASDHSVRMHGPARGRSTASTIVHRNVQRSNNLADRALDAGCSALHVSSGGLSSAQQIPVGPSYQIPLARAVKAATTMPVIAVGLITDFVQAEAILSTGDADLIALARAILYDPRWPWHAAAHFGAAVKAPNQYLRSQPRQFPDLFDVRADD